MGAHQQASGHHIASSGEALGQGGEDQVGIGQGIEVDASADGVVGDHRNPPRVSHFAHRRQVHAAQQRIARQFHDHGCRLVLIQRRFHLGKGLWLQQLAAVEHHLRLLQHIHVGKAELQGGALRSQLLNGG